jgi:formate hydrogenlyase transcriptional activator
LTSSEENLTAHAPYVTSDNTMRSNAVSETFSEYSRALILHTLRAAKWVIGGPGGAAERLGLKRTTLIAKMKKLGISRPTIQSLDHSTQNKERKSRDNQSLDKLPG